MRSEKNIFKEENKKSNSLKYFIISFSVFIVILAVCSAFLLMKSLDFDLSNIVDTTAGGESETETQTETEVFSTEGLTGKSNLIFICTDEKDNYKFSFTVLTDFESMSMTVKTYGEKTEYAKLYANSSSDGLKAASGTSKYVKFTDKQLKDILELFENVSVNVPHKVDYRSETFNLKLEAGRQQLSEDYLCKLLLISDDYTRSTLLCDIIDSVLTPENFDNSNELFKSFVNSSETDISVIDFSEAQETLEAYSKSCDRFLPTPVK